MIDYFHNNLSLYIINNIRGDGDWLMMEYVLKWSDDYYNNNALFESTTVVVIVISICLVVYGIKPSTSNDNIEHSYVVTLVGNVDDGISLW